MFTLNKSLTPFLDKNGSYVEVLAILPTKIVLLYADEKTDTVTYNDPTLVVGDKIYFDANNNFLKTVVSKVKEVTSSINNKQSPTSLPKDLNSRY